MDKKIKGLLQSLIDQSERNGLPLSDLLVVREYLQYNELWLCFDTLLTQMNEYNIEINEDFYSQVERIAGMMRMSVAEYSYMKELINSSNRNK